MIKLEHLQEWVELSGVSEEITRLNVVTLTDPREIDQRLQRNTKSRTKHSDYGTGGWWVSGVDPTTGEPQGIGGQFKPDNPSDPKRKYLGISGLDSAPLFLDTGNRDYWPNILAGTDPIMITEGAKKAGAALTAGIACVSIAGVYNGQKAGSLKESLAQFCKVGRRIYLGFDADQDKNPKVRSALDQLGRLIAELGSTVSVLQLPHETKGIDDYAAAHGHTALTKLVHQAITFETWRKARNQQNSPEETYDLPLTKKQMQLSFLRDRFAGQLRLNTRGYLVELNGEEIKPDYLYLQLLEKYGIDVGKELPQDAFLMFASEREYDPVKDYLEQCYAKYGGSTIALLDQPATDWLHTDKPIYDTYLRKTLIAAVARTYDPGCKFDTATVLQGDQGLGKSTLWKILAGRSFFDDSVDGFDTNQLQKLHRFWIEELGEIDKIQNKSDVATIKAFLSRDVDNFRIPWGRTSRSYPRKFIIVGSVNPEQFLQDSTGDRRFWVIPVTQFIDLELVRAKRDQIWAAAVALCKQHEQIWLPKEQELEREEINKNFRADDPWEEPITEFVTHLDRVKMHDILTNCLNIDLERQDRRAQTRVGQILRLLGWKRDHDRNGKFWAKKQESRGSQGHNPDIPSKISVTLNIEDRSLPVNGSHNRAGLVTHDPCDPYFDLPKEDLGFSEKRAKRTIKPGDKVEILTGSLRGQIAIVEAINGDIATIKGKTWVFSNDFALGDLKWLKS